MSSFESIFRSDSPTRDKFLSRVFGIFSEEIVHCWCNDTRSPYENLGRPTLLNTTTGRRYTLDFTFRSRVSGHVYVGEMKCELEYENYQYLILESPTQLQHHMGEAFKLFLGTATSPATCRVNVQGKPQSVDGAILVWGQCTPQGQAAVVGEYGLHAVLAVDTMIRDLQRWQSQEFAKLLATKESWCQYLFAGLRELNNSEGQSSAS